MNLHFPAIFKPRKLMQLYALRAIFGDHPEKLSTSGMKREVVFGQEFIYVKSEG